MFTSSDYPYSPASFRDSKVANLRNAVVLSNYLTVFASY